VEEYYSPFVSNAFRSSELATLREVYANRIRKLYQAKYPDDFKQEEAKKDDDKKEEAKVDVKKEEPPKPIELPKPIEPPKPNEAKPDEAKPENPKPDEPKKELNGKTRLAKAIKLLDEEYFGNEQEFYEMLCKKYDTVAEEAYSLPFYTVPLVSELLRDQGQVKCAECEQVFPPDAFPEEEWNNGSFLACSNCAKDRFNVSTLKWSKEFKSDTIELQNNEEVATITNTGHKYVCANVPPVKHGIHCWRFRTENKSTWVMWGVSAPKVLSDSSFSVATVWGAGGGNQTYKNGAASYNLQTSQFFNNADEFIDVLLDLNECKLKFKQPEVDYEIVLDAINKDQEEGFVPHVNLHYANTKVQVKKIPYAWYGKYKNRVKFKH